MNGSNAIEVFHVLLAGRTAKRKELQAQLDQVSREVEAIEIAYKLYREDHGILELPQEDTTARDAPSLTKRREKALIDWAHQNDGVLLPKKAKNALIAAGLVKPGKGAGWIVYGTINNMDCWEKMRPGVYRLTKNQLPLVDGQVRPEHVSLNEQKDR